MKWKCKHCGIILNENECHICREPFSNKELKKLLKNKNDIKIKKTIGVLSVDLKVKLTLWSAIKMRIAGINNVLNKKKTNKNRQTLKS